MRSTTQSTLIGGSAAALFFCLLLSNSVLGQQIGEVGAEQSAKLIALENHGLLPDLMSDEEIIGGALYIKLSESAVEGDLTTTLNKLFATVGLRLEAATPMVVRDQLLSPSVKSYRSSLSGNHRSAALKAERGSLPSAMPIQYIPAKQRQCLRPSRELNMLSQ